MLVICLTVCLFSVRSKHMLDFYEGGAQVFVISREKIQKRGYETLFKYMTVNNARTTIGRSVLSAPKRWQVRQ